MSFKDAIVSAYFKNYAKFEGRARRKEYWWFFLFRWIVNILIGVVTLIVFAANGPDAVLKIGLGLLLLFNIATIIPDFAVTCRRLHDVGKSGTYMFFWALPVIGEILVWVWSLQDGQPWTNQYGEDPKGRNKAPFGWLQPSPTPPSREEELIVHERKKCSGCGTYLDADVKFCPVCGQNTQEEKQKKGSVDPGPKKPTTICYNCGKSIDVGTAYCPFCGENLKKIRSGSEGRRGLLPPTDLD